MKIVFSLLFLQALLFSQEYEYYIQVLATKNKSYLNKVIDFSLKHDYTYITRNYINDKNTKIYRLLLGPYKTKAKAFIHLPKIKKLYNEKSAFVSRFKVVYKKENIKNGKLEEIKLKGFEAYQNGDKKTMMRYLKEAAKFQDMESIYFLGKNYHYGYGAKKDLNEAKKWYFQCETYVKCLEGLANIYLNYENEDKPNLSLAKVYLQKASKKGSKKALAMLQRWEKILKAHETLSSKKVSLDLVKSFIYKNIANSKIQNIQISNIYEQDGNKNINISMILNNKIRKAFLILNKRKNSYWKQLEFKLY